VQQSTLANWTGIASDVWKARFNGQRVSTSLDFAKLKQIWLLPVVAGLFILSQTVALFTTHVESLWFVSTLLGVSYGCLFNVLPMLVLEWYGMGESTLMTWRFHRELITSQRTSARQVLIPEFILCLGEADRSEFWVDLRRPSHRRQLIQPHFW
jgi:hypothetical protein